MLSKLLNKIIYVIKPSNIYKSFFDSSFIKFKSESEFIEISGYYGDRQAILHIEGINKKKKLEMHYEICKISSVIEFLKIVCNK